MLFHIISYMSLFILLHYSKLIPLRYEIILLVIGTLWCGLLLLFAKKVKKKPVFILFLILTVVIGLVAMIGGYHVKHMNTVLKNLTESSTEISQVSVFVLETDTATEIQDINKYKVGILADLDRENTNEAIRMIEEELGCSLNFVEYDGVLQMADGMQESEIDAMILNEGYLDIFSSISEEDFTEEASSGEAVQELSYLEFVDSLKKIAEYTIETENKEENEIVESTSYEDNGSFLVYISGMDKFGHISVNSRSDVNILAAVNTNTKEVLLISIPRDYYVPLSISNGVKDKLTHSGIYGIDCSKDTVEMLFGLQMDYYLKINFSGFESIVNALGGITVWSDYAFDVEPDFHFVEGNNELMGLEALAFARERYSFANGDNQRGVNQMNVIISIVDKCTSTAVLKNFSEVLESAEGTFETDMPYDTMASIVRQQLVEGTGWDISTYRVTGRGSRAYTYSISSKEVYVMEPDEASIEEAVEMINEVLNRK